MYQWCHFVSHKRKTLDSNNLLVLDNIGCRCRLHPTRSPLDTSTSWPPLNIPIAFRYRLTMRAIVVLPVPGLPVKII